MKKYVAFFIVFLLTVQVYCKNDKIDSLRSVVNSAKSSGDSLLTFKSLKKLGGFYYYEQENYNEALEVYNECLKYASVNDSGHIYNRIAVIYWRWSDFDNAMICYRKSFELGNKAGNKKLQATALNNIGFIYLELENNLMALDYYKQALKIRKEQNNTKGIGWSYLSVAKVLKKIDSLDQALNYEMKALQIFDSLGIKSEYSNALNNIGNTYFFKGNYSLALKFYKKGKEVRLKINNQYLVLESNKNIVKTLIKLSSYKEAEEIALRALKNAKMLNSPKLEKVLNKLLHDNYLEQNNHRKALEYFKEYSFLKDSIFDNETKNKISELEIKYQTEKKEKEIELLSLKDILNQAKIKSQNSRIRFVLALAIVFLGLGVLVTLLLVQKHRSYRILLRQNIEITHLQKKVPENNNANEPKLYSELPQSKEQEIVKALDVFMKKEKYYLNQDCSIDKVAKSLNTNRQYLSQVINSKFEYNFTNYINQFRINDSRALLSDSEYHKYTIEAIGKLVGFKSRSSFITAFKRFTGVTPSDFKKKLAGRT